MTITRSKDVQRLARCGICNLWRNLLLLDLRCWLFGTRRRRAQRCRHARNMSVTSMKVSDSICVPHHSLHKLSFNFRKASFLLSRVSCVFWVTSQIFQIACKSDRLLLDLGARRMAIASEMRCVGFAPALIASTQALQSFNVTISGQLQPCAGGCSGCSALQAAAREPPSWASRRSRAQGGTGIAV